MYFLSEEEKRYLMGRLLPLARRHPVHQELRGWTWREPPMLPAYDVRFGAYEVANKYCPTSRDVYLRRVMGVRAKENNLMQEGAELHRALAKIVLDAKRIIYSAGAAGCVTAFEEASWGEKANHPAVAAIPLPRDGIADRMALQPSRDGTGTGLSTLPPYDQVPGWRRAANLAVLRDFEYHRIVGRVEEVLARHPKVNADSLVALALPMIVEQQLDGTFLGLSAHLSVDALTSTEPMVFDIKFGSKRDFHRLSTTAYALVLESLFEHPVEIGCVVYGRFVDGRLLVERDLHVIDDELRQWFIDERDERGRMVSEEVDPGKPDECDRTCPYLSDCRGLAPQMTDTLVGGTRPEGHIG